MKPFLLVPATENLHIYEEAAGGGAGGAVLAWLRAFLRRSAGTAVLFACFRVGEVYLEGEKTDRLAVEQAGLDGGEPHSAHERRRRHHLNHQRGVAYPALAVISHPAATPESLWRGMHGRSVLPLGDRRPPGRRGEDTRTCLPRVPGKGMSGQAEVYRPLADGEIVCTSPSPGSTAGAGGSVNARSNRLCRACTKRRSTLPDRGQAIGRWSGFESRQGGWGL